MGSGGSKKEAKNGVVTSASSSSTATSAPTTTTTPSSSLSSSITHTHPQTLPDGRMIYHYVWIGEVSGEIINRLSTTAPVITLNDDGNTNDLIGTPFTHSSLRHYIGLGIVVGIVINCASLDVIPAVTTLMTQIRSTGYSSAIVCYSNTGNATTAHQWLAINEEVKTQNWSNKFGVDLTNDPLRVNIKCRSAVPPHEPLDTHKLRNMLEEAMKKRASATTTAELIAKASSSSSSLSPSSSISAAELFADRTKFVVLVLSGAFNPVHNMHAGGFEAARLCLEKQHKRNVIGGYISPSSDSYVSGKLKLDAMSLFHRNTMCHIASASSSWLTVCPWGMASGFMTCRQIEQHINIQLPGIGHRIEALEMCGADHAVKYDLWTDDNAPFVCLSRPGYTKQLLERIRTATTQNVRHHPRVNAGFVLVPITEDGKWDDPEARSSSPPATVATATATTTTTTNDSNGNGENKSNGGFADISSTAVRTAIASGSLEKLRAIGGLHPGVVDYIHSHADALYLLRGASTKSKQRK